MKWCAVHSGVVLVVASMGMACGPSDRNLTGEGDGGGGATAVDGTVGASDADEGGDESSGSDRFDVGVHDLPPPGSNRCVKESGGEAPRPCQTSAPERSFDPVIEWAWTGDGTNLVQSTTLALVANLDGDASGAPPEPCDGLDVIVLAYPPANGDPAHLVVLDGEDGSLKRVLAPELFASVSPALGDLDGDGRPDLVAAGRSAVDGFSAFVTVMDADGNLMSMGDRIPSRSGSSLALADLDGDGDVEIFGPGRVYDHNGTTLFDVPDSAPATTNTAADLDGDGDLEIVTGKAAYHADGSLLWRNEEMTVPGFPQVANLDDDPEPEVLVTSELGFWVLEHDGTMKLGPMTPTGDSTDRDWNWRRPAVIHDFDSDGSPDFAQSSRANFATYEADGGLRWSAEVLDASGLASATAFDFLGDGSAEAMYADESHMRIFNDEGEIELEIERTSGTWTEYPVVADVDNDGSAEIVVTSNRYQGASPPVQVIGDAGDTWIQARRIWNQHTYHVTNVREDGSIPQHEEPHWETYNTFRSNAQIEDGQVCIPPQG